MLNLVSLTPDNNQLPREAKKRPLFYFCLLVYISNTFLRILADPKRAHLWVSSIYVSPPMVLRFSFNVSGIVPNAPSTMGITFVLTPTSFEFLSRDLDVFILSRPLLLLPFHHPKLPRLLFGSCSLFCRWSIDPVC